MDKNNALHTIRTLIKQLTYGEMMELVDAITPEFFDFQDPEAVAARIANELNDWARHTPAMEN
jgi:hypothetical protein